MAYTLIRVDRERDDLRLFLRDDGGAPLNGFSHVSDWMARHGYELRFAMNAGMYDPAFSPVGLFVVDGTTVRTLNTRDGPGNFHLKPNGVFLVTTSGDAKVVETSTYPTIAAEVRLATQSGPLLVDRGRIHPKFNRNSASKLIRNGVGVTATGEIVFVISEAPVNLWSFASLFRTVLDCPNALYLDGNVSSLYAPELGRNDARAPLGPMIGVVAPLPAPASAEGQAEVP
ncbi:MAG TPA: phosphodiester glycosidase family protein [Nevskiaceae bacterium]|nr:phosphodiester glycosidase family protein [Nevskiaceae bacterium]